MRPPPHDVATRRPLPPPATRPPSWTVVDDADILARLRGADEDGAKDAFDALFRGWYARLVRVANAVVREPAVAEELVQDVLLELWRRRERLENGASVPAYLLQATRNRALNHVRHRRVEQRGAARAGGEPTREPAVTGELAAAELDAAVRRALDELTPRTREVFELSRVHGLRYAEIAAALGVSVKAVEAQMGRALRTLRERLAEWLPEGDKL